MRIRSCLSSAAIVTALLASSSYLSPAMAQKVAVLAPVTGWAVTRVDDDGDSAYCALARRFLQNTILTIARNQDDQMSLALDFQAPKMDPAHNIKVVLDPGAGEQRSYYITPASNKAFVVRLGSDAKFMTALRTTGLLRIEAAGGNYSFNLADIDTGEGQLRSCLSALGQPQPASGTAGDWSEPAPKSASNDSGVQQQIATLKEDIDGLRSENQRLSKMVSSTDDGADDITHNLSALEKNNRKLRQAVTGPASGISTGEVEAAIAPGAGGDAAAGVSPASLQQQNEQLQEALATATAARKAADSMQYQIASLQQENDALKTSVQQAPKPEEVQSSQSEMFVLKQENQRLQKLLTDKSGPSVVVETLQAQVDDLQSKLNNAGVPTPLVPPSATPPAGNDLQKKVDDLSAQLRDRDQKLVELSNLTLEVQNLKTRNADLEKQAQDAGKNPGAGGAALESLQKENSDLKQQIASLQQNVKDADSMKAELEKRRAENEELKKQAPGAASAANNEEIIALRKENADLKQQLAEQTEKNKTLESQLADAQQKVAANTGGGKEECLAQIEKAKQEADSKNKSGMQALAKENTGLKSKLAQLLHPVEKMMGRGDDAKPAPEQIDAETPITPPPSEDVVSENDVQGDMTEAQRQEASMRHNMSPAEMRRASEKPAEKPIEMHKGEDPYAKIDAPNNVKAYESEAGQPVQEKTADKSDITWSKPDVKAAKAQNVPQEVVQQEIPPAMPAKTKTPATGFYSPDFSIQDVLVHANVAPAGSIQLVEKVSGKDKVAYQWHSGDVYGSAEQSPLNDASQFGDKIQSYLDKTKKRCNGDFAVSPDDKISNGSNRIESYEIACVSKSVSSSAAVLFVSKAGTFTVMANETSADQMGKAMDIRDKLLQTIGGS